MEFAAEVRRMLLRERPQVVAVEIPFTLGVFFERAARRSPEMTVLLYPAGTRWRDADEDEDLIYLTVEPADPFTEAVRTAIEIGAELVWTAPDQRDRPHVPDLYPDPYAIRFVGLEAYVRAYRTQARIRTEEIEAYARGIAWKLQGTNPEAKVGVVVSLNLVDAVMEAMEEPQDPPEGRTFRYGVDLINPHPECLAEITVEYPYLQYCYECFRAQMEDWDSIDRRKVLYAVLKEAEKAYEQSTGERLAHWHRMLVARYSRNLALSCGELSPSLFDLTTAARSVVDDNYGWEVWQAGGRYPPQMEHSDLPTENLSGEEVWRKTRRIRLRRRLPTLKQRLRPAWLKPRPKEKTPGEWAQQLDGNAICSYPPEDIVVEGFGRFLQKKAKSILSEERVRVEPFTT
jgi:hypothetical protein